jgi:S1-C subfamily serine protease
MQLLIQSLIYILLFSLTITCASAESEWDSIRFAGLPDGRTYNVSMGSGFFVNRNYIVTNRHVVTNCKNIAIRGAISPKLVKLAVLDEDVDLALLYSESEPKNIPYLRINYDQIAKNDVLFTVGYPLEHGENGDFVIREAKVIEVTKNPNNGFSNITFSDVINHGNSGGPVLMYQE